MKSFETGSVHKPDDYSSHDRTAALISIVTGIAIIVVAFVLPLAR